MAKRKKSNSNESVLTADSSNVSDNSALQTSVELDIRALRVKNGNLVKANTKLQLEKSRLQTQYTQLQEDYFKLNSSFVNLKNVLSTIDGTTKAWFPKFVEFSEMFTKIMQLCSVGKTVTLNKDPRTQAVQPHTVNGHVLQHPTISLPRLNNTPNAVSSRSRSNLNSPNENNSRDTTETALPTSGNQQRPTEESTENDESNDQNEYDVERIVYRRRRNLPVEPLNINEMQEQDDNEDIEPDDEMNNEGEYCSRLFTIREEEDGGSFDSPDSPRRIISREVKIYIDRLPSDYVRRNICRVRKSSTESSKNSSSDSENIKNNSGNTLRFPDNNTKHSSSIEEYTSRRKGPCIDDNSLLDNSTNANATVIQETVYRSTMSPVKRREARYFGEQSSYLQSTDQTSLNQSFSTLQTDQNLEISDNISAIQNLPCCSAPHVEDTSFHASKHDYFNNLGLTPRKPSMATSTPLSYRLRNNSTRKSSTLNSTFDSSISRKTGENILSKVAMKRGGSGKKKKIAHVVLKRMSLEKSLSGSPLKYIKTLSNNVRQSSQFSKKKSNKSKKLNVSSSSSDGSVDISVRKIKKSRVISSSSSSTNSDSDVKENVDTSNENHSNDRIPNGATNSKTGKSTTLSNNKLTGRVLSKGTKRLVPPLSPKFHLVIRIFPGHTMIQQTDKIFRSPRPKRAARPTTLKEPTLNKKMRRSK